MDLFGMLKPCSHGAARYGIDPAQWRAHMCGLCLGLRDGQGHLARTATNTDAIVLSVLTEAQLDQPMRRTTAGRCALRGMRRAEVAAADSPGVLLASTASLLLGSAKIRDHVEDRDGSVLARRPMLRVSGRWANGARAQARRIGLDVEPLVAAIDSQSALESRPASLDELTGPTQLCAAEFFGHTAVLAERAENIEPLRLAGRHFGRIAHLADAVEDFDADCAQGRFNPLAATGTGLTEAYDLLQESEAELRRAVAAARLRDVPAVRWILLDPLSAVLRRLGTGVGAPITHACKTSRAHVGGHRPGPNHYPAGPSQYPGGPNQYPAGPPPHRTGPDIGRALGAGAALGAAGVGAAMFGQDQNQEEQRQEQGKKWWDRCCEGCDCCSNCGDCCSCCGDGCCCDGCGCDCGC
ncbi:DUF5685 family protein [Nocardia sp. NPDC127579]|uniref:DUF5685 family protein n=1 Tax=Nocardia sp. NPDC127579 TaxID=3345402 RepID=UPI00363BF83B